MKEKIFVCPKCQGELFYWTEEVLETRRKINPHTGKILKARITFKGDTTTGSGTEGVRCKECGWMINTISLLCSSGTENSIIDFFVDIIKE